MPVRSSGTNANHPLADELEDSVSRSIYIIFAWIGLIVAAGCERPSNPPPMANANARASVNTDLTPVAIQLNWRPEAEHGGYYAAAVHGYFAEEGLAVEIKPGGPEVPVLPAVAIGQVAFGINNADTLVRARAEEADVIAVFAPIQDSPRCLMAHAESGIRSFSDLETAGGITLAWNPVQPFAEFLKKKYDFSRVHMTRYSGSVGPFVLDNKYVQQAYSISEPYLAKEQGAKPVNLMLSDAGFNTYTSLLVTNSKRIREQPDVVRKLVRASQRGWQKYLADPEETNRLIAEKNPEMPLAVLAFGAKELKRLCLPEQMSEPQLGRMTPERWQTLVEQLVEIEALAPNSVDPPACYTTEFLQE
jgi:NitT/TauT family transport system substrate-binding protein